ncbi:BQ5605_C029g10621 [Microbotryum silenes-dioicae]|uniref:BQ5605_C029g10621 protein n=1 Tax=Microbotryum silenes-dioicae TaxID=796604 RepID=A0A2X0MMZ8_9BASI|nr:BQ5605_C029g10621 [Microbotryum silenes-dioicae]
MSPFLGLVLLPLTCLSHLSSLPFWAGSVRLTQAAGPAARSPEPTGSALLFLLLKQLLGLVSLVRRSEPYHRLSRCVIKQLLGLVSLETP